MRCANQRIVGFGRRIDMDVFQEWATLVGAVVAAISSVWGLWRSFYNGADRIKVGFGPLEPPIEPGEWMHVVSRCDHLVTVADYGFVDGHGALLSLIQLETDTPGEPRWSVSGSRRFERRGELFEVGAVQLRDDQIGAYAATVGREGYTLAFGRFVPSYRRLFIRLRVACGPSWQ